jgi:hypothetical protein
MEFSANAPNQLITPFPAANQTAAQNYKLVYGIKNVILTVDGQMNGADPSSPDLSKLIPSQVQAWADQVANTYCAYDFVDGLNLDLEPARAPYLNNLLIFLKQLSGDLLKGSCMNALHPYGRTLGVFVSAAAANSDFYAAIGSNGYAIISGYDLSDNPPGTPTTPSQYGTQIKARVTQVLTQAKPVNGSFIIGIPAAASVHEFTKYVPASGASVTGYPMYSATQPNYVTQAVQATHAVLTGYKGWLGTSLWTFSDKIAVPPSSNNLFYPATAFDQTGEMVYLQTNL